MKSPVPSRGQVGADHLGEDGAVRGHHEAVLGEEVAVRVVECCDGGLADELRVEDLGDEEVGAPLHVQAGAHRHLRRPLADQLYLQSYRINRIMLVSQKSLRELSYAS